MNYSKLAKSYKSASVETASPGKLVLMLYDGALRFMAAALAGFEEENFLRRNEQINNNLIRTQNILSELQNSIDMKVNGDLPQTLYSLYGHAYGLLQRANVNKDSAPIYEAQTIMQEIRDAWAEMLTKTEHGSKPMESICQTA
ncbi:MAG: flagellar export chaperone FliS [Verrucomicrobiota bacterium]